MELQRALTAIESARDHFANLYEFAPSAYFELTEEGAIVQVNRAGAELLRIDGKDLLGVPFVRFVAPGDIDLLSRNLFGPTLRKGPVSFEASLLRGDGSCLSAQLDGLLLKREGTASVVLTVVTDIAARKETEQALREQEKFFRLIAENLGDFIAVLDLEGRRIYNSPSYQRLFGHARDLRGTDSFAEIHEEDRARIRQAFLDTVRTGIGQQGDYRFVLPDGSIRWMESVGAVIRDNTGQISRVVVVARDVTERKQADIQLRIAATAFEADMAILVTDADKVIKKVNRAFSQLTGYAAEEVIGKTPTMLSSGRHDADFYAAMWEGIHRCGSWQGEIWNRRRNGEIYPQWLTIAAVRDVDGRVVTHYVATMTDITERKAAEEAIRHMALYDDLTQLPNRRLLMDRLQRALATCARSGHHGALLLIDLDDFKQLNDTHGHDRGDLLLQEVAVRLKTCIREADTAARLGGDEFVVMLGDLSENSDEARQQAESVGEKILVALNRLYILVGKEHHCTPSIGITLFVDQRKSVEHLIKQADLAMYQSKAAGRNTMRFFDPGLLAGPGSMPDTKAPGAG
ncbi:MAG: PAS/PAC sensor-containing diguanylate cyclase/phosphodiesterase [Rhodocyclaceae bacterium]|nr:MAG: PAS/PAC sensor-containing diguanylate cyclase/phosphodiesterase [Rhodocyclaceae bacterium]TND00419.1 MAG: PAS/PAC sensor-containing diguanylate cyclase/phosphodiesterase [Rhodocyclaceae bacterium]